MSKWTKVGISLEVMSTHSFYMLSITKNPKGDQSIRSFRDTVRFNVFAMHPFSYFYYAIPYLALRSLTLNLQMQAAEAGWGKKHNKHG